MKIKTKVNYSNNMADYKKRKKDKSPKSELLKEVSQHYEMWNQDNEKRMHRKNGWNDVTDAYYGVLPDDWPYITKIIDPRIRTSLIEKNARLLNSKLRGRLIPREGGDVLKAQLNNTILDYQWDTANNGGSMMTKMSISDMDARLYASKFALISWKYEVDEEGNVVFDGNEMTPLDLRDCGIEPSANHIRGAKWFQLRTWEYLEDIEAQVDGNGDKVFKNLGELKRRITEKLDKKSSKKKDEYQPRLKQIKGMEDRTGEDSAFPVVKLVTEYRKDKWITFVPDHDLILREIANPYDHGKIPIAQLRYYPIQDDPHGESEVEHVIPLWKAIQATVCSYMDEVILKMRPPLKILENEARVETLVYAPEAQWLMNRPDAVTEMQAGNASLQYFQTTYSALVSAFNIAMGDLSQGTSSIDPFETEAKTATEVRATIQQQSVRDQKNQNDLAEFIKDIMSMWLINNKQFLFTDPDKQEHVMRIVGNDKFNYFKRAGLDDTELPTEALQMIGDIISQNPDMSDIEVQQLMESAEMPKFPVILNPKEKDPEKIEYKPKMRVNEMEDSAELSLVPEDLEGTYDYIPDVRSMSTGAGEELAQARQRAIEQLSDQNMLQLLQVDGWRPNMKELVSSSLEEMGLKDADRFFVKIDDIQNPAQAGVNPLPGIAQAVPGQAVPGVPQANTPVGIPEQMA